MYLMTKRFTESQLWNIFRKSLWCFFSPFSLKAEWWTYKYLLHLHENQPSFFSKMRWIAQICILFILIFRQITTFYLLSFGWNFNDNPLQDSCLGNPMDRGSWWATVHGVAKSWTWLRDWAHTYRAPWVRKRWLGLCHPISTPTPLRGVLPSPS